MRRVVFVRRAQRDLVEIRDYIARDNPRRAESFIVELIDHAHRLAEFPLSYPVAGRKDWRKAVHEAYLILYSVTERELRVQRIVHSAMRR